MVRSVPASWITPSLSVPFKSRMYNSIHFLWESRHSGNVKPLGVHEEGWDYRLLLVRQSSSVRALSDRHSFEGERGDLGLDSFGKSFPGDAGWCFES